MKTEYTRLFLPGIWGPNVKRSGKKPCFTPAIFTPAIFTPAIFTPAIFTPAIFTPAIFTPAIFTPAIFTPAIFTPAIFTLAQKKNSRIHPNYYTCVKTDLCLHMFTTCVPTRVFQHMCHGNRITK
jgi:hypothetical protein